jgi:hypothetical protein
MRKTRFGISVAAIGFVTALLSAWQMADHVRMVDILALFASGAAAGCGLTSAIVQYRQVRKATLQAPSTGGTRPPV